MDRRARGRSDLQVKSEVFRHKLRFQKRHVPPTSIKRCTINTVLISPIPRPFSCLSFGLLLLSESVQCLRPKFLHATSTLASKVRHCAPIWRFGKFAQPFRTCERKAQRHRQSRCPTMCRAARRSSEAPGKPFPEKPRPWRMRAIRGPWRMDEKTFFSAGSGSFPAEKTLR